MITFKNYIKKYFPSIDFDFFERQDADHAIFPLVYDFDMETEIPQIDYKPFDYSQETGSSGGGVFAENVADYIFQNYENAILTKYADKVKYNEETELYDLARTNLKRTIFCTNSLSTINFSTFISSIACSKAFSSKNIL